MPALVTFREAAKIIGIRPEAVRYLVKTGKLSLHLVSVKRKMVPLDEAKKYRPNPTRQANGRAGGLRRAELA